MKTLRTVLLWLLMLSCVSGYSAVKYVGNFYGDGGGLSNITSSIISTNASITYITNQYLYSTNVYLDYVTNQYLYTTNVFATYITNDYLYTTNVYNSYLTNTYLYTTNVSATYITNNYFYSTNAYLTYATNEYFYTTNLYSTYITNNYLYTTNVYATYITNDYLYTTNVYASYITNDYFYSTNAYITNLNVNKLTVQNIYTFDETVTNGLYYHTNNWAGPTNNLDMRIAKQSYRTFTPMAITNLLNQSNYVAQSVLLTITNASDSNVTLYIPADVRTGDGTRAYIVTNSDVGMLSIEYDPSIGTNAVYREFY